MLAMSCLWKPLSHSLEELTKERTASFPALRDKEIIYTWSSVFSAIWNLYLASIYKAWFSWTFFPLPFIAWLLKSWPMRPQSREILKLRSSLTAERTQGGGFMWNLLQCCVPQGQHKNAKIQFMVSKPTRGRMNTLHSLIVLEQPDPALSFTCHKFRDSAPFQVVFTT